MSFYLDSFRQCFFIPPPTFTEKDLPDQTGRVFIVTGGYTGVGKELCKYLYAANGTVYIAGRSQTKADKGLADIKAHAPASKGKLEFLQLDLADLPSIKASAQEFLGKEKRLDVLTNNAGVMVPPAGSQTAQAHELQMGTNCLGPYLFTLLLTPVLQRTAATSPPGSVRVTWAASLATAFSPTNGVTLDPSTKSPKLHNNPPIDYAQSKACNVLLAKEYQKRHGAESGVVSNAWNPGNLASDLQRHQKGLQAWATMLLTYEPGLGGLTELFAGWSPQAGRRENWGRYIGPWGRFAELRGDVRDSEKAGEFWEYCERETKQYM
ncbi:hypothetical protein MBLNU230_g5107t1 [Neophaeotheca triangularis]